MLLDLNCGRVNLFNLFNSQLYNFLKGYKSSIRQHENDVLVCVDLTHKVMRNETVWDMISDCARNSHGDYRYKAEKLIIGVTVLTFYNNKTYQSKCNTSTK